MKLLLLLAFCFTILATCQANQWTKLASSATTPGARQSTASFTLSTGGKIYVISGGDVDCGGQVSGCALYNDVLGSTDGVNWDVQSGNSFSTPFVRIGHQAVTTGNANDVYVIAGADPNNGLTNDIFKYQGDQTFQLTGWGLAQQAQFAPRQFHGAVYVQAPGTLPAFIVLGGYGQDQLFDPITLNDIWYSSDGFSYTQRSGSWWSPRYGHSVSVYQTTGTIVLTGGSTSATSATASDLSNEVWLCSDGRGITWSSVGPASWTPRFFHGSAIVNNSLYIAGGRGVDGAPLIQLDNDVWTSAVSTIGRNFVQDSSSGANSFTPRAYVTLVAGASNNLFSVDGAVSALGDGQSSGDSLVGSSSIYQLTNGGVTVTYSYVYTGQGPCINDFNSQNCYTFGQSQSGHSTGVWWCEASNNPGVNAGNGHCGGTAPTTPTDTCNTTTLCSNSHNYQWSFPNTYNTSAGSCTGNVAFGNDGAKCFHAGQATTELADGYYQPNWNCIDTLNNNNVVNPNLCTPPTPSFDYTQGTRATDAACSLPLCHSDPRYTAWFVGYNLETCLQNGQTCHPPGGSTQGYNPPIFICIDNTDNETVSQTPVNPCSGAPTNPSTVPPSGCQITKACTFGLAWHVSGYSQYCVGTQAADNFGDYCQEPNGLSTLGLRAPIFQCFQNGLPARESVCDGLDQPTGLGELCNLLDCWDSAYYQSVGIGQCVDTENQWSCCAQGNDCSSVSSAPVIYECVYPNITSGDIRGAPGHCRGAPPSDSNPCVLPVCGVKGDPEFKGFRGQKYEIHGIPGSIFNIISSPHLQYNAEFVFLGAKSDRECNTSRTHPWTHPGTYLGRLGFRIGADRVYIESGDCISGIVNITINDQQLAVGDDFTFGGRHGKQSLEVVDEFTVRLHLLEVEIELQNSDNFFNQIVTLTRVGERTTIMHGLLGQTWRNKVYKDATGKKHYIEGHANDYLIQDDDLFGSDFLYNVFDIQQ